MRCWHWLLLGCLGLTVAVRAEQLRVIVGQPEVTATDDSRPRLAKTAALWQVFLGSELSHRPIFAVVEREQLDSILREWALQKTGTTTAPAALLGADCIIASHLARDVLGVSVINALTGTTESNFTVSVSESNLARQVAQIADTLEDHGRRMLARQGAHSFVSVLDYENLSPFPRNRWIERYLARRVRQALLERKSVLVMESEELTGLLKETRLQKGGFAAADPAHEAEWSRLRRFQSVSGTIQERQPEGQPLSLVVTTTIRDLLTGQIETVAETVPAAEIEAGLTRVISSVSARLGSGGSTNSAATVSEVDRRAELPTLLDKAGKLMLPNEPGAGRNTFRHSNGWGVMLSMFCSPGGNPYDKSEERKANLLKAIQYLQAAVLIDDRDLHLKSWLATLLTDPQAENLPLAMELAEEIAGRPPPSGEQEEAIDFLIGHLANDPARRRDYCQLAIERYPGGRVARGALWVFANELIERCPTNGNVMAVLGPAEKYLDQIIGWTTDWQYARSYESIRGTMNWWFKLTQSGTHCGKPSAAVQKRGQDFVEQMIVKYPAAALTMCSYWSQCGPTGERDTEYWLRRAIAFAAQDPEFAKHSLQKSRFDMTIHTLDEMRLRLARRLMKRGKYTEAGGLLELIAHPYLENNAQISWAQCAFELGRYTEALKIFEKFGVAQIEGENVSCPQYATRCREKLGTGPPVEKHNWRRIIPNLTMITNQVPQICTGTEQVSISALAAEVDRVWIGATCGWMRQGRDTSLVQLEKEPGRFNKNKTRLDEALGVGGLASVEAGMLRFTVYPLAETISHPWVTGVALAKDRVFVGTSGKGLDVLNRRTERWQNVGEKEGLPSKYITALCLAGDDLWIGMGRFHEGAVARYDLRTGQVQGYLPADYPANAGPPLRYIRAVLFAGGRLWCLYAGRYAYYSSGVAVYDPQRNRWQDYPRGENLAALAECNGRMWFGADSGSPGLLSCSLAGDDWRSEAAEDFPRIDIFSMITQGDTLYIGTHGLMSYRPRDKSGLRYEFRDDVTALCFVGDDLWLGSHRQIQRLRLSPEPLTQ